MTPEAVSGNAQAIGLPITAQQAKEGPAAFRKMDLAAVLRNTQKHFVKHAPVPGMASLEERITYVAEANAMLDACIARTAEDVIAAHIAATEGAS